MFCYQVLSTHKLKFGNASIIRGMKFNNIRQHFLSRRVHLTLIQIVFKLPINFIKSILIKLFITREQRVFRHRSSIQMLRLLLYIDQFCIRMHKVRIALVFEELVFKEIKAVFHNHILKQQSQYYADEFEDFEYV